MNPCFGMKHTTTFSRIRGTKTTNRLPTVSTPNSADLFGRMREVLEREVDLVRERRNLRLARRRMESVEPIEVPAVLPFGSQHVLAMERLQGRALGEVLAAGEVGTGRGKRLADELFTSLVLHPLLQARGDAVLHGDPHAGNVMLLSDGRLGVLDWSLAAILRKRERVLLVQTLLSGLMLDRPQLRESSVDNPIQPASPRTTESFPADQDPLSRRPRVFPASDSPRIGPHESRGKPSRNL